jgi:hypothetical protein
LRVGVSVSCEQPTANVMKVKIPKNNNNTMRLINIKIEIKRHLYFGKYICQSSLDSFALAKDYVRIIFLLWTDLLSHQQIQ